MPEHANRPTDSFLAQRSDLLDQRVDFFGRELARVLWHAALGVGDDVRQLVAGCAPRLIADKLGPAQVAALGSFSLPLRALTLKDGVPFPVSATRRLS